MPAASPSAGPRPPQAPGTGAPVALPCFVLGFFSSFFHLCDEASVQNLRSPGLSSAARPPADTWGHLRSITAASPPHHALSPISSAAISGCVVSLSRYKLPEVSEFTRQVLTLIFSLSEMQSEKIQYWFFYEEPFCTFIIDI